MSADPQKLVKTEPPRIRIVLAEPKPVERDTVPRESEKEKIKRQLYNLIDRVDKL